MKLSDAGLELIASEESFVPLVYLCQAGVASIGYGHVVRRGERYERVTADQIADELRRYGRLRLVSTNGVYERIGHAEALDLLHADASVHEAAVSKAVTAPLTQPQFDALVSLSFNIGAAAFMRSDLVRLLNAGGYRAAADEIAKWRRGGGRVLPVLERRRARETAWFCDVPGTWREIQTELAARGLYTGAVDGDPGPRTRDAVRGLVEATFGV